MSTLTNFFQYSFRRPSHSNQRRKRNKRNLNWKEKSHSFQMTWYHTQKILKEINPEYSLEGPMLKLKLWYFGHRMQRANSLEKMLGKTEGRKRRGRQRKRWLDGITDLMDMSLSKLGDGEGQGGLVCCSPQGHKELDMTERVNWTDTHYYV